MRLTNLTIKINITTSHILMQFEKLTVTLKILPNCLYLQSSQTTDIQVEANVRSVACDGLLWGASKLVPIGYGIRKLQINCVIEDDKVRFVFVFNV